MIPTQVRFTGITIPTSHLLHGADGRKVHSIAPSSWSRVEILNEHYNKASGELVDKWLAKNIAGRWSSYPIRRGETIVVLFEDDSDALLFKLLSGETAWLEATELQQ